MPLIETIGSGSAKAFGLNSFREIIRNYQPDGTTRVFSQSFNTSLTTPETGSLTSFGSTVTRTLDENGKIYYATGFVQPGTGGAGDPPTGNNTSGLRMNTLSSTPMNGVDYTFIGWYKGNQSAATAPTWAVTTPIFGDPRGSIYISLGLEGGKIAIGSNGVASGSNFINDNTWHMCSYVYKSNNRADAYIDNGNLQITNKDCSSSPSNNLLDYLGVTYPYAGIVPPSRISGIQVYSQALTQAQIQEIYTRESSFYV
jgi:hypothetical protein